MTANYSVLDKVAGVRLILSAAKRVQEARPDAAVSGVRRAITIAILGSLEKLAKKDFASLDAKAVLRLNALRVAEGCLAQTLELIADEATTRELNADERAAFAVILADKAAKREAKKASTVKPENEKKAAKPKPVKADAKQGQLLTA